MSPGHVRAALKLAGLVPKDREWLLEQLDMHARTAVASVLQRLENSDVKYAPELNNDGTHDEMVRPTIQATIETIRRAEPHTAADVLMREPDWVIRVVLQEEPWPWLEDALSHCAPERRVRIGESLRAGCTSVTSVVRGTIVECFAKELTREQELRERHSRFESLLSRIENRTHRATE